MNISRLQLNNMMIAVTTALQPLIRALPVTPVEWADQNYYLPKEFLNSYKTTGGELYNDEYREG